MVSPAFVPGIFLPSWAQAGLLVFGMDARLLEKGTDFRAERSRLGEVAGGKLPFFVEEEIYFFYL
jgi:hypothetical protein